MEDVYFCPQCGAKLEQGDYYFDENLNDIYVEHCPDCDCRDEAAIRPLYEVGDNVKWQDPCRDDYESDEDYTEVCNEIHTVTDVLYYDTFEEECVYELDNGMEVCEGVIDGVE